MHLALSKIAEQFFPAYEAVDGPLTAQDLARLRKDATPHLPKVKVLQQDLFG